MKTLICTIVLYALTLCNSFGQDFFPMNLKSLVAIEKTGEKNKIVPNTYFLNEKGFFEADDLLFINKKTTEKVKFSSSVNDNKEEIRVDYYSTAKDLTRFVKRASESGLKKINDNLFEHKDKNTTIRIDIKRNTQSEGKNYHLLSLVVIEDLTSSRTASENKAIKFPIDYSYPLQNTIYYFETDIKDDKSYSDEYFINIKLAKTPKYANKIMFLDDNNWKITLADKQTFFGTYNQSVENRSIVNVSFNLTLVQPKVPKGYLQPVPESGALYYASDLKKSKHNSAYYKFFFGKSYHLRFEGNDLLLSGKHYENYPTMPAPTNGK